jgi:hypothetical protein
MGWELFKIANVSSSGGQKVKKWMMLVGLVLGSGSALAAPDVISQGEVCKITDRGCSENILIRQAAIFTKLPDLKEEVFKSGSSIVKLYRYKGKSCGGWPQTSGLTTINEEKYIKLDSLSYALIPCISSVKISGLSKPIISFDGVSFDLSRVGNASNTRDLISGIVGTPISKIAEATSQIFGGYSSWSLVYSNYKFNVGGLIPKSLYLTVKNSDPLWGSLLLEISETDTLGKMIFYSDTPDLKFKPSLKDFENFKANDAIMIRLTGRFDRDIFDFSHPPKLTTLKGIPAVH